MAVNPYLNFAGARLGNANEQSFVNSLVAEAIQMYGMDVKYLPRTLQKVDSLYHEDVISSFESNFTIEAYVDSVESFDGDGDILANFGLRINDQLQLMMSQNRFREVVTGMTRPLEGDLIYFPLSQSLFEIKFVEHENQFFPNGTLPSFSLRCELFDYSGEGLNTGVADVDAVESSLDIQDDFANNTEIQQEAIGILDFTENNPFGKPG